MPARHILRIRRTAPLLVLLAVACNSRPPAAQNFAPLHLTSPSFSSTIPGRYASCSGQTGNSPALAWGAPPAGTRSFVLIVTDPDAPFTPFTHWLLWNLPPDTRALPESIPTQPQLPSGARQGRNDFGHIGYGGPCPPGRSAHRYFFDLYALDTTLTLPPGASKKQLVQAMQGHILAAGQLIGRYPH
ncbi:MAG: YbhB/YbcL family Raf kinase inhibitor-like protein [Acidobacteriaceae bacterium]